MFQMCIRDRFIYFAFIYLQKAVFHIKLYSYINNLRTQFNYTEIFSIMYVSNYNTGPNFYKNNNCSKKWMSSCYSLIWYTFQTQFLFIFSVNYKMHNHNNIHCCIFCNMLLKVQLLLLLLLQNCNNVLLKKE